MSPSATATRPAAKSKVPPATTAMTGPVHSGILVTGLRHSLKIPRTKKAPTTMQMTPMTRYRKFNRVPAAVKS